MDDFINIYLIWTHETGKGHIWPLVSVPFLKQSVYQEGTVSFKNKHWYVVMSKPGI